VALVARGVGDRVAGGCGEIRRLVEAVVRHCSIRIGPWCGGGGKEHRQAGAGIQSLEQLHEFRNEVREAFLRRLEQGMVDVIIQEAAALSPNAAKAR
jgi:hypothetical protein